MRKGEKSTKDYIQELEDEILVLSFKLKHERDKVNESIQTQEKRAGTLIHDLKNSVGVIYSFSNMILEGIKNNNTDKLKRYVTVIKDSANFSLHFLNQTSNYRSVVSLNKPLLFEKLNVVELLNRVVNQFEKIALKKNIIIKKDFQVEGVILLIDKEQLTLALSNIMNNAIRFSAGNTTIFLSVIEFEDNIEIIISDEGIGVKKDDLVAIFQEYFVVNTYSKDEEKCVGLGLTIAKKIIQQHKGLISIESVLDKGSTVKIVLPKENFTS
jgi:signal transduction histidine kinase